MLQHRAFPLPPRHSRRACCWTFTCTPLVENDPLCRCSDLVDVLRCCYITYESRDTRSHCSMKWCFEPVNRSGTRQRTLHKRGLRFNVYDDVVRCPWHALTRLLRKVQCVWGVGADIRSRKPFAEEQAGCRGSEKRLVSSPGRHRFVSLSLPLFVSCPLTPNILPLLPTQLRDPGMPRTQWRSRVFVLFQIIPLPPSVIMWTCSSDTGSVGVCVCGGGG